MQEMGKELKVNDEKTIDGKVLIEKIILTSNKKISAGDIKYLQVNNHK